MPKLPPQRERVAANVGRDVDVRGAQVGLAVRATGAERDLVLTTTGAGDVAATVDGDGHSTAVLDVVGRVVAARRRRSRRRAPQGRAPSATSITHVGSVVPGIHGVPAGGGSTSCSSVNWSHVGGAPLMERHATRITWNSPSDLHVAVRHGGAGGDGRGVAGDGAGPRQHQRVRAADVDAGRALRAARRGARATCRRPPPTRGRRASTGRRSARSGSCSDGPRCCRSGAGSPWWPWPWPRQRAGDHHADQHLGQGHARVDTMAAAHGTADTTKPPTTAQLLRHRSSPPGSFGYCCHLEY